MKEDRSSDRLRNLLWTLLACLLLFGFALAVPSAQLDTERAEEWTEEEEASEDPFDFL